MEYKNSGTLWLESKNFGQQNCGLDCCPKCFDSNQHSFWLSFFFTVSCFIWRNDAWTVDKFGLLTDLPIQFLTSYLSHNIENGWTAAQRALIPIITHLNFDIPLHFSFQFIVPMLDLEGVHERSTNLACWPLEQLWRSVVGRRKVLRGVVCSGLQRAWKIAIKIQLH